MSLNSGIGSLGTLFHVILPSWITGFIPSPSVCITYDLSVAGSFSAPTLDLYLLCPACSTLLLLSLDFAIDLVAGNMISEDSNTDFTPFEERSKGADPASRLKDTSSEKSPHLQHS